MNYILIPLIILLGCGRPAKTKQPAEIKTGVVTTIRCISAPMEDYSLYLPKTYTKTEKAPVIIFFDSHGKGMHPVGLYKELSEKYGIILAGSNKIKNGMQMNDVFSYYLDLYSDLKQRFSIDTGKVFLSGFSGGARVASVIALSQRNSSGVISCGAGMDPGMLQYKPSFPYVGIAGLSDMNYSELATLNEKRRSGQQPSQFLVFDGSHEWPPMKIMEEAILFLLLKNDAAPRQKIIEEAIALITNNIDSAKKKSPLAHLRAEQQYINYLTGVADVTRHKHTADSLLNAQTVKSELHQEYFILSREESNKKNLQEAFTAKNIDWWKSETASLKEKIKGSPESEAAMYRRVLSYASLVAYSYTSRALASGQTDAAGNCLLIYSLVDPENPDCAYFKACYHAQKNDHYNTIKFLNEAIDKGFSDAEKIKSEPSFSSLQYDSEFTACLDKIR